jgi:hypothetical protein
MHHFDFDESTQTIKGNKQDYFEFIEKNYLYLTRGLRVLEVGANSGHHTKIISKYKPSYLECVEADPRWKVQLEIVDMVICFGVLYHHHSSLHLLEIFANYYKPKYIMLDSVTASHPLEYLLEKVNISGSRNLKKGWKHCGVNFKTPFFIINQSLDNMGYEKQLSHKLATSYFPKSNGWVAMWKLKDVL